MSTAPKKKRKYKRLKQHFDRPEGIPDDKCLNRNGELVDRPAFFTPKHGHGKLYAGGVAGNRGGGNISQLNRRKYEELVREDVLPFLRMKMEKGDDAEKRWACEQIQKYGMGERRDITSGDDPVQRSAEIDERAILIAAEELSQTAADPAIRPGFDPYLDVGNPRNQLSRPTSHTTDQTEEHIHVAS